MKEKCDNICSTCPVNGQIYCTLMFLKANNESMKVFNDNINTLSERMTNVETFLINNPKDDKNPFVATGLPVIEPSVKEEEVEE